MINRDDEYESPVVRGGHFPISNADPMEAYLDDHSHAEPLTVEDDFWGDVADDISNRAGEANAYVSQRMERRALIERPQSGTETPPEGLTPMMLQCIQSEAERGHVPSAMYLAKHFPAKHKDVT